MGPSCSEMVWWVMDVPMCVSVAFVHQCRPQWNPSLLAAMITGLGMTLTGTSLGFVSLKSLSQSGGPDALDGDDENAGGPWPEIPALTTGMTVISSALSFLLVFRLSWSFQRWWEARGLIGTALSKLRNLAVIFANHADSDEASKVLREAVVVMKVYCGVLVDELAKDEKDDDQDSQGPFGDRSPRRLSGSLDRILSDATADVSIRDAPTSLAVMLQDILDSDDRHAVGEDRLVGLIASRRRMLLAHAWLTRAVSDGRRAGLIEHFEHETALHCQSDLLQVYYSCLKIKTTPLPYGLRVILILMLCVYSLVLFPQYLAYAFVMKLSVEDNEHKILERYPTRFYTFYSCLCVLGILFFQTLHLVANELDDPFGTDASDIPLLTLRDALYRDLDDITQVYRLEHRHFRQRNHKNALKGTVRAVQAQQRLFSAVPQQRGPKLQPHPPLDGGTVPPLSSSGVVPTEVPDSNNLEETAGLRSLPPPPFFSSPSSSTREKNNNTPVNLAARHRIEMPIRNRASDASVASVSSDHAPHDDDDHYDDDTSPIDDAFGHSPSGPHHDPVEF